MSLKTFHLLFIALSVVVSAFFAAWAVGQYRALGANGYLAVAVAACAAAIVLGTYGAAFQRKMKRIAAGPDRRHA